LTACRAASRAQRALSLTKPLAAAHVRLKVLAVMPLSRRTVLCARAGTDPLDRVPSPLGHGFAESRKPPGRRSGNLADAEVCKFRSFKCVAMP